MAYDISTTIEIAATPEQVTVGSTLTITSTAPDGSPVTVKAKVVVVEPGRELQWVSRMLGIPIEGARSS